ncbi:MAG TPA: aldo/keto reductase [Ktedonobacterales bacterium]|nr:aldo/keto reductase [Ktedonobacterales bacterium]
MEGLAMEYRRLGASGLRVSVIGLGGNTFGRFTDAQGTEQIVSVALDAGINFFDTANVYGTGVSEEHLGRALQGRRDQAIIATKAGMRMGAGPNESGSSREHLMASVQASLKRLQTDYIDLFQIHRYDPDTPLEETLGALDDLVRSGAVRYVGCSNYDAWQMTRALWISDRRGWAAFIANQPEYSMLSHDIERELVPACLELGVGIIPYSPLAGGVLTGKYAAGQPAPEGTRGYNNPRFAERLRPATLETVSRLSAWASERGHSVGELALAWLAAQPAVSTIIAGVTKPEQVTANVAAGAWRLSQQDLAEIDTLLNAGPA